MLFDLMFYTLALNNGKQQQPLQPPKPQISEKEKKIRNLQKKLDDIGKLKEKIRNGVKLELNQQEKIRCEEQLREDLERLKILE